MNATKLKRQETHNAARSDDEQRAGRSKLPNAAIVSLGMLVALFGGFWMGRAALALSASSGDIRHLATLYASLALTAVAGRLVYRRGGMLYLSIYAGLAGLATGLGPMLL